MNEIPAAAAVAELPTIFQAFANAKRAVGPVGKTGHNSQQHYDFRGIDAVVNEAAPHLDEQGVINVPTLLGIEYATVEVGQKRTQMAHVKVKVRYTFYGPRGDSFTAEVPGESMDSGDKATAKAMTVAWRIALIQVLNLPTGDPDPDESSYERSEPDVDDGEWGEFRVKIDAIGSLDDARALDKELRAAYAKGDVGATKAKNIKAAIAEKGKTLPDEPQGDAGQRAAEPEVDPELAQLVANAMAATTIADLERVRDDAKQAGKWAARVPLPEGGTHSLSMVVQTQKALIEKALAAEAADPFADANKALAGQQA